LKKVDIDEKAKLKIVREFMTYITNADERTSNPEMAAVLNRLIAVHHPDGELYRKEKKEFNELMLGYYDEYRNKALQSDNPLKMAVKLAIAGNIIDFGPDHEFSVEDTVNRVLKTELKIDDSLEMFKAIKNADKILYLGDNAGEIVMDKLFLSLLDHPRVQFVVRGEPVLNDSVMSDAIEVGMLDICPVISNGTDLPSTVIPLCSEEFQKVYKEADLIISKGQGNLEGLLGEREKNIYFLFTVKCDAIARITKTNPGDFVLMHASKLPDCSQSPCL
jgi:uncharacterized protein with ATP-grasp and redox domains